MSDEGHVHGEQLHDGAAPAEAEADGVTYPVSDDMGESSFQVQVCVVLLLLLRDYVARTGRVAFVGINQFFYWQKGDASAVVCPDLYVIDGEAIEPDGVPCWKVWERGGKGPALAFECVSDEWRKDYDDAFLTRYERLGVQELIRYDAGHGGRPLRRLLTHWVRDARGRLVRQETRADRVLSAVLGVWLVVQPDRTIRLGVGPGGETLWPTDAERAAAEAAARAVAEAAARAAAGEAAARAAAEARVAELEAELARLRG